MATRIFNILIALLVMTLLVTGCNSQDTTEDESETKASKEVVEVVEPEDEVEDNTQEEGYNFIIEDNDPSESELLGATIESNGTALPDGLVGTWTVVEGIPEGLSEYTLSISPDGYTIQTTVSNDGTASSYDGYTVLTDTGYYVTDANGMTLMSFDYSNGSLITYSLTGQETLFQK